MSGLGASDTIGAAYNYTISASSAEGACVQKLTEVWKEIEHGGHAP